MDKTLEPLQPSTGIPQMMLVAFSCELYMKVAYAVENRGKFIGDEHHLNKLFSMLSEPFRDAVRGEWDKTAEFYIGSASSPIERDLYNNLKVSKGAFQQLRYFHESGVQTFQLGPLPDMLKKVLLERHPRLVGPFGRLFRPATDPGPFPDMASTP